MKTLFKKCIILCFGLIGILLYSFGCKEEKLLVDLEDRLELKDNVVDVPEGTTRRTTARNKIRVDSVTQLPDILDSIPQAAFDTLKHIATRMHGSDTSHYVIGLKISYAMNQTNNMKLLYQPAYLKRISGNSTKTNAVYERNIYADYYKYNGSAFTIVPTSNATLSINNYTTHITFKKQGSTHYRTFNNTADNDSTGDVKSILYSFQEIDSVINGNTSNKIYILNAAEVMRANHTDYLKHSLILGPDTLIKQLHLFYLKYGNLSHLCPPSCSTNVFYNLK